MGFITDAFKPQVPSIPTPAKAPPLPDVNQIKDQITQQDQLSRKAGGMASNILTSPMGDKTANSNTKKTILG